MSNKQAANNVVNSTSNSTTVLIKPKYVKHKSVFYKESTYIKDLLGEGK